MTWITRNNIAISEIKTLLDNGYEVEVDSPDGYVSVLDFVNKGIHDEYRLKMEDGETVNCSEKHLFETNLGWCHAGNLSRSQECNFLTKNGFKKGKVTKTGYKTAIVDIHVDHPNHRYFTNGVSSHNSGKTLTLCHLAAGYLALGKNVLYITLEMAEEEITRRIDTNLLNLTFDDLDSLPFDLFQKRVNSLKLKTSGKLIVKEYPSTSASVDHFRALLTELKMKKKFIPDIIMIDYLNICASSRIKSSSAGDMYSYVKSIAEEVRGFAQLVKIPVWSATQLNRAGFGSSDPEMTDVAESFGLPATVDLLLVLVSSESLRKANQIMFKQLKNRYHDMEITKKFVVGVDKSKMKLYDVEESAQVNIDESGQEVPQQNKFERKDKFRKLVV